MQYVPDTAIFDPTSKTYNILDQFTTNVQASAASTDTQSPEFEILQLLATPDDSYIVTFTASVNAYLAQVNARFVNGTQAALEDYMVLAEGRRLLYKGRENAKPVGGLNEFELTLPIAAMPDPFPITRMTKTGDVEVMPAHEVKGFVERAKARSYSGGCPMHCWRAGVRL